MNRSKNKLYTSQKVTVFTALMFVLAVLMLVVSCPVKRLLQRNFVTNATSQVRTNEINSNQPSSANYNATASCVAIEKKVNLVNTSLLQQFKILPASLLPAHLNEQAGFGIYYFLSGISGKYVVLVFISLSSLPLFLQYRRLLI